jgi:acyl-CoA thioesterase YciA
MSTMSDQLPKAPGGPQLRTIAMPADANAGGSVFGGWTLSQMDLACGSFAAERAGGRVATVSIEAMRFLRPVAIGDEVSCYCSLEKVGESSMAVKVKTWARSCGAARRRRRSPKVSLPSWPLTTEATPGRCPKGPKKQGHELWPQS